MNKQKKILWIAWYKDDFDVAWPAVFETVRKAGFDVIEKTWHKPGPTLQVHELMAIAVKEQVAIAVLQYFEVGVMKSGSEAAQYFETTSRTNAVQAIKSVVPKVVLLMDGEWSVEDKNLADETINFPLLPSKLVKLLKSI